MINLVSVVLWAGANASSLAPTDPVSVPAAVPTPSADSNPAADSNLRSESSAIADALQAQDAAPATTPAAPAPPKWTGSVTAGAIITTGNSETRAANASADAEYKRIKDRITLGFLWNYADDKNSGSWNLTDRKTSARAKYDYFLTEKTYALAQASAEADYQADLDLRTTIGVGAGRQILDNEKWKFSAEGGLSQFDENFGSSPDNSYLAARGAYNATWNLNKMWQFGQLLEIYPSLENLDDFYGHLDTRAKVTLTGSMFGQAQWIVDYDNTPAAGKDRVDQRLVLSVGWKF